MGQSGVSGWRKREERDGGQFFLSSRFRVALRHGSLSLLSCQLRITPLCVGECAELLGLSPRLHLGRVLTGKEFTLMPALTHTIGCSFAP